MRKRQSFLLTVLVPENTEEEFCGRLKTIATGETLSFCNYDELVSLIMKEMNGDLSLPTQPLPAIQSPGLNPSAG